MIFTYLTSRQLGSRSHLLGRYSYKTFTKTTTLLKYLKKKKNYGFGVRTYFYR